MNGLSEDIWKMVLWILRLEAFGIYTYDLKQANIHIQDNSGLYIIGEGLLWK